MESSWSLQKHPKTYFAYLNLVQRTKLLRIYLPCHKNANFFFAKKNQLSQEGNGFLDHIRNDHNMWKYLYFLVYLKERDYEDYSGIICMQIHVCV